MSGLVRKIDGKVIMPDDESGLRFQIFEIILVEPVLVRKLLQVLCDGDLLAFSLEAFEGAEK